MPAQEVLPCSKSRLQNNAQCHQRTSSTGLSSDTTDSVEEISKVNNYYLTDLVRELRQQVLNACCFSSGTATSSSFGTTYRVLPTALDWAL
ncbi:hypothetical protein P7K49_018641 [Saguinus oedipus]|uniref:Uncharacterized protein n=1 Tax=Saguinus oedipus TaxID=9490 RepID=A0ABQ9V6J6_SAGOE|nr:hypothetical protein P7K49_018641 [Saguinus oedipus]